jgi:hypothetical protein
MEEKIQEKKELSVAEIEAQSVLELPDRQLMQNTTITQTNAFETLVIALVNLVSLG